MKLTILKLWQANVWIFWLRMSFSEWTVSFEQFIVEPWSEDFVSAISQEKRGIDCLELPLVQHTRLPDFHKLPSLLSSKLCMISWLMVLFKVMADGKRQFYIICHWILYNFMHMVFGKALLPHIRVKSCFKQFPFSCFRNSFKV